VLLAHFAQRFWTLRTAPAPLWQRRELATRAVLSLLAMLVLFGIGMAALYVRSRAVAQGGALSSIRPPGPAGGAARLAGSGSLEGTASMRLVDSLKALGLTLIGRGDPRWRVRLAGGLAGYLLLSALVLLPLGRRFRRGITLVAVASPPLLIVLAISSAPYGFGMMVWPPRVATLLALVLACVAFAANRPAPVGVVEGNRVVALGTAALIALSWGLQLPLLGRVGYSPWARLKPVTLLGGRGHRASTFPDAELRFLRCLGGHLPRGLPVSSLANTHPVFHLQSVVFQGVEGRAPQTARLRVIPSPGVAPAGASTWCRDPGVGGLAVEADCAFAPVVSRCTQEAKRTNSS
jgi:hypothetical protein